MDITNLSIAELQSIIKLAVENNLSLLEVGNVKIVPGAKHPVSNDDELSIIKNAEIAKGRRLTGKEREDEILFGPGGSIGDTNDGD